jgi:hypothetical protein
LNTISDVVAKKDYGGRRLGIDRRQFSYTEHIPARRSNKDRRSKPDRRNGLDRRKIKDSTKIIKVGGKKIKDRRCFIERRTSFATVSSVI